MYGKVCVCVFTLMLYFPCDSLLVIPEDVATGFAAIYGFAPPLHKGNDHRFGFGFRFGSHADFQILYEFGPQTVTKPLQPITNIRSASYRQRLVKRRPLIDLLLRTGLLRKASYDDNIITDCHNEPR